MGNYSNDEAFDGMHKVEQLSRPMKDMLRVMERLLMELSRNIKQKVQAMLESVQNAAEFRMQMEKQIDILNRELENQINRVRDLSPELADRLELEKADLLHDMDFQLDMIGATWKDASRDEYVENLCNDLSGFAELSSIAAEFEQTRDVDLAMNKIEAVHKSIDPIEDPDKHKEMESKNKDKSKSQDKNMNFEKSEKFKEHSSPADEFEQRIKNAVKQAKAFNASPQHQMQRQRQMQMNMGQKMQDAMERVL